MTAPPPRILVCDHRGAGIEARFPSLEGGNYDVRITRSLRESMERLARSTPQLIVLDPLTRGAAAELLALGAAHKGDIEEPPVLIVWDPDETRTPHRLTEELGTRPWDLVHRDASPEEFNVRLRQLLSYGRMLQEMGQLRHRAVHDDRTELLRPESFQARMNEHFAAAKRHKLELAFVMMDLDNFGQVNKRYDHTVGDELIKRVGEVIRKSLRTEDVAGRLGGDEFAVLLPYTAHQDALRVVNRLRERIADLTGPFAGATRGDGAPEEIPVSTSIGYETFDGTDVESEHVLRRNAERALRKAKREGGDRAVYFRSLDEE